MTVEKKNKRKREGHTHTIMLYGGGGGGRLHPIFPSALRPSAGAVPRKELRGDPHNPSDQ